MRERIGTLFVECVNHGTSSYALLETCRGAVEGIPRCFGHSSFVASGLCSALVPTCCYGPYCTAAGGTAEQHMERNCLSRISSTKHKECPHSILCWSCASTRRRRKERTCRCSFDLDVHLPKCIGSPPVIQPEPCCMLPQQQHNARTGAWSSCVPFVFLLRQTLVCFKSIHGTVYACRGASGRARRMAKRGTYEHSGNDHGAD